MKVGLFHLIVLDDDTSFKRTFIAIRQASNKNYDMLAKRNHKGLTVESFHRILRKRVTIAAEERGIIDMFVPTGIATGYTWNSMLIVGTYIPRRILAMNRKLHFSLKINLNIFPTITQNNSQATINYLNLTDSSRYFSFSILKNLIEEHRTAHSELIHNNRNLAVLQPDDSVMARTAIKSDL